MTGHMTYGYIPLQPDYTRVLHVDARDEFSSSVTLEKRCHPHPLLTLHCSNRNWNHHLQLTDGKQINQSVDSCFK